MRIVLPIREQVALSDETLNLILFHPEGFGSGNARHNPTAPQTLPLLDQLGGHADA